MKAVIMAGGEGTRLRPLTCNRPKPMVPVMNKPVMEHIINLLKKHRITEIAVTLQYMPQVIQDYFGDGSDFGVQMHYFIEETPLGTAGSVKNAEKFLDDTFIVISGDALTDIDLDKAIQFHNDKQSIATLVLTRVDVPLEYGVVVTDASGKITRFLEKPSWSEVFSDTVNTGIYILNPKVLDYFESGEMFDFSKDLFPILLNNEDPMFGYVTKDYWCDIGDLTAYQQCHFDILDGKVKVDISVRQIGEKVWVEDQVEIDKSAKITGPVLIGSNTKIKNDVQIFPYTVIGENNLIGAFSSLKHAILWKGCNIGKAVQLRGCTVCNGVHLQHNSSVFEQSVIGDETLIKKDAVIKPGIKVWPSKIVENGTEVKVNLIWGAKYSKALFGDKGISGEINVDITPEFASRLGAAYGALFKGNAKVAVGYDDTNASSMLKGSFISGFLSSGVTVYDFGQQILPITRAAIKFYGLDGGIHLSTISENNDFSLFIDFLDAHGANIDRGLERKLENTFIREDFKRCEADSVKSVIKIQDFTKYYLRNMINGANNKNLQYRLLINASSHLLISLFKDVMTELNCQVDMAKLEMRDIKTGRTIKGTSQAVYLSGQVVSNGYDLGAIIEDRSEKLLLIDEKGKLISDELYTALISLITLKTVPNATIIVPISAPSVIEKIAARYNGRVIRTKTSSLDVMNQMVKSSQQDATINDQFILNFDAVGGLIKIMDYMRSNQVTLSELIQDIPSFHIVKKEVECAWDAKGKVIREIIEDHCNSHIELMEGVKIYQDNGWVLVLPDLERPVCKVIGEGYTEEFAEALTDTFIDKVKKIGKSKD